MSRLTLYPRPFEQFVLLQGKIGVEVGVLKGEHALSMLKQGAKHLILVDPYKGYIDFSQEDMDKASLACKKLLRHHMNVEYVEMTSAKAAALIQNLVDFVYIDAAHDYTSVKEDIIWWWPKIRENGVIGGHDFDNGTHICHNGVVEAVTEFAVNNKLRLYVESPDWWIHKR